MIDSIFIALSGMLGHERGLNVIGNNVANMNSPGFRGSTLTFSDVFTGAPQNNIGNRGQPNGGGLDLPRASLDLQPGLQTQTGGPLDLFLKGTGYFVLQDESGAIRYTRAGNFTFNDNGELVASDLKSKVMARDANGALVPITLKDLQTNPAKQTTKVTLNGTLSDAETEESVDSLTIIDPRGGKRTLRITFTRDTTTQTQNGFSKWKMALSENGLDVGSVALEYAAGRLELADGQIVTDSIVKIPLTLSRLDPLEVSFDLEALNNIPVPTATISVQSQDGHEAGTIATKTFDAKGVLKITYSNGQSASGARLILAQVPDEQSLVELDHARFVYRGTQQVALREAADDLQVISQSLEQANVDLTSQFTQLILMQRGYQASSQVVSTANDMLQELFAMRGQGR